MILVPTRIWWRLLLVPLLFGTFAEGNFKSFFPGAYPQIRDHPEQQCLWQKLDHFNQTVPEFWKQRYFINSRFYRQGGPVFLELGGEQSAVPVWLSGGSILSYAKRMGALYVLLEHRYYGKSQPTYSLSTDNLQFLSSRQALKDAVYFRTLLTNKLRLFRNKWVVFGGSYARSFAAFLRVKYPSMFHSAVAYSAPVKAKANFFEYMEVVQKALFRFGHFKCVDAVRNATEELMYMLELEEYHSNVTRDFGLCGDSHIDSEEHVSYFLDVLIGNIAVLVQYNRESPLKKNQMKYNFHQRVTGADITLNYFCGVMSAESLGTPYERYAFFMKKRLEAKQEPCLSTNYDNFILAMRNTEWNGEAATGWRQWFYQTCTEFGFFQTTDSENQPFLGLPMSYFVDQCERVFDLGLDIDSVNQYVQDTNEFYYKNLMSTGSRILFPNGELDPWHALSINSRMNGSLIGMSIKDSSHCQAMYNNHINDPKNLRAARRFIFSTLVEWLQNS